MFYKKLPLTAEAHFSTFAFSRINFGINISFSTLRSVLSSGSPMNN